LVEGYGAEVELVPGVGGAFEVTVDGRLMFSKKQTGRFPTDEEIDALGAGRTVPT
jgi:selT/selW/selH-like putative selenoprotein